jgi:hypothetical protein
MFEEASQKEKSLDQVAQEIKKVIPFASPQIHDFYINLVTNWLNAYDDGEYLGCFMNKVDDVIVALYHHYTIYLLGKTYPTIMYAPKILFHLVDPSSLHIDDVLMKHNSVGNGSAAMLALLKYAKLHKVLIITGNLSTVDDDHKERRDNYYKKFNFDVGERRIVKKLKGD